MSRPPRFTYPGALHNLTLRCNNRELLFTAFAWATRAEGDDMHSHKALHNRRFYVSGVTGTTVRRLPAESGSIPVMHEREKK